MPSRTERASATQPPSQRTKANTSGLGERRRYVVCPSVTLQRCLPEASVDADELPAAVVHEQHPADALHR